MAFELWLSQHWPDGLKDLGPPATDEEIRNLETTLGVSLPRDFVEFLRIHNGQKGSAGTSMQSKLANMSTQKTSAALYADFA